MAGKGVRFHQAERIAKAPDKGSNTVIHIMLRRGIGCEDVTEDHHFSASLYLPICSLSLRNGPGSKRFREPMWMAASDSGDNRATSYFQVACPAYLPDSYQNLADDGLELHQIIG